MQDWTLLPQILTREVWAVLLSTEERQLKKADVLVKHLVSFGLRHPSERTCAVICALVARSDGLEGDTPRQVALLSTVKSVLKTNITGAKQAGTPLPGGYLTSLPADTGNLPLALRTRFDLVVSPVEVAPVLELAFSWALRSTNRSVLLHRFQQGALPFPAALPYHPQAAQSAQAMLAFGQAALPDLTSGIPGFHLTPAGVAAAAAAAGGVQPGRQAGGNQLRSLLDRAEESAPPARAAEVPPQQTSNAQPAALASSGAAAVGQPSGESAAVVTTPHVPQTTGSDFSGAVPPAAVPQAAVAPIGTEPELEASVVALANQHYNKDLPSSGGLDESVKKKPSGRAKAVAKKPGTNVATKKIAVKKKPAAASSETKVLKRPASKESTLTRLEAARLRPNGCSKCREKVGCTPSCWAGRGRRLVD
eukprot:Skav229163  [mRNA]  locus=scaffold1381:228696:229958:- [translate_table: standard]